MGGPGTDLGRLYPDGVADGSFNPGANGDVFCIAPQADGKLLVAGEFTSLMSEIRNGLARFNSDGSLDTTFDPAPDIAEVDVISVLVNGKILVSGSFTTLGGQPRAGLARLNPDGSLDLAFNPNPDGSVFAITPQADGKILVSGYFMTIGGF